MLQVDVHRDLGKTAMHVFDKRMPRLLGQYLTLICMPKGGIGRRMWGPLLGPSVTVSTPLNSAKGSTCLQPAL